MYLFLIIKPAIRNLKVFYIYRLWQLFGFDFENQCSCVTFLLRTASDHLKMFLDFLYALSMFKSMFYIVLCVFMGSGDLVGNSWTWHWFHYFIRWNTDHLDKNSDGTVAEHLKKGKLCRFPKTTFYFFEDSWQIFISTKTKANVFILIMAKGPSYHFSGVKTFMTVLIH